MYGLFLNQDYPWLKKRKKILNRKILIYQMNILLYYRRYRRDLSPRVSDSLAHTIGFHALEMFMLKIKYAFLLKYRNLIDEHKENIWQSIKLK